MVKLDVKQTKMCKHTAHTVDVQQEMQQNNYMYYIVIRKVVVEVEGNAPLGFDSQV